MSYSLIDTAHAPRKIHIPISQPPQSSLQLLPKSFDIGEMLYYDLD